MRLALVLALALAGCAGDDVVLRAGDEMLAFTVGGLERLALVHAPERRALRAPLVFDLHGSGLGAESHRAYYSGLDAVADREGLVVAYGQGAIPLGGGFQWHVPGQPLVDSRPAPPDAPDDVAYIAEAIRVIDAAYSIDRSRVYATGFSGGARMSSQLACDLEEIAAVAPIAGVRFPEPCLARPVTVIAFHGTDDASNPYNGNGSPWWTYSVPEAIAGWAAQEHCGAPTITQPAPAATLESYACRDATVELYTLEHETHEPPRAVDAYATMWERFRERKR